MLRPTPHERPALAPVGVDRLRAGHPQWLRDRAGGPRPAGGGLHLLLGVDRPEERAAPPRPLAVPLLLGRLLEGDPAGGHLHHRTGPYRVSPLPGVLRRL